MYCLKYSEHNEVQGWRTTRKIRVSNVGQNAPHSTHHDDRTHSSYPAPPQHTPKIQAPSEPHLRRRHHCCYSNTARNRPRDTRSPATPSPSQTKSDSRIMVNRAVLVVLLAALSTAAGEDETCAAFGKQDMYGSR